MLKWHAGLAVGFLACLLPLAAQQELHGRKWQPQKPAAHIEIVVTKAVNGKPVPNAAVIFHPMHGNRDEGNMEIKTNHEGVAVLDLIAVGDKVRLQVIADGFQTYGQDFSIDTDPKQIEVKLEKPVKQSSVYAQPGSASVASPTPAAVPSSAAEPVK